MSKSRLHIRYRKKTCKKTYKKVFGFVEMPEYLFLFFMMNYSNP
jgi:hypothetical protein